MKLGWREYAAHTADATLPQSGREKDKPFKKDQKVPDGSGVKPGARGNQGGAPLTDVHSGAERADETGSMRRGIQRDKLSQLHDGAQLVA